MRLWFKDIINRHKGKPAMVVAHGPSLNHYQGRLAKLSKDGYVIIGINDWYLFHKDTPPQYVVIANSIYTIQNQWETLNRYPKTTVVYASIVDQTPLEFAEKYLKCDYLPYKSRNFYQPELTMQEEIQRYCGHNCHYGSGDTGALHQIALGILLGCNPVYFVGMDLDYRLGFATNTGGKTSTSPNVHIGALSDYRERILKDLAILRDSAKRIGVSIVNLSTIPTYDTVPSGKLP